MNELFGVSMELIMWVLVALLGLALSTVLYVYLANRVMFKVGVRNIPRRRAQTVLIVLGLMLSTLIISAAFTTGDTVNRSITGQAFSLLGSVDEAIQPRTAVGDEESIENEDPESVSRAASFDLNDVSQVIAGLEREPLVDGVLPVYADVAVAVNEARRLSSPRFTLTGLDPQRFGDLPDLRDTRSGARLRVTDLAADEMYLNKSGAEELDARVGDRLTIIAQGTSQVFTVKAIVNDTRLAGSAGISIRREGGVVSLATAQTVFKAPGRATYIAVSNKGDTRGGLQHADAVADLARVAARASATPLAVLELKSTTIEFAEQGGSVLTAFFLAFGLFAIGAGVLLIFMIFVMLAAERKPEMGMARAVGTKRADLVQTFLSEGMSYNILAAAVGAALGVGVAVLIASVMGSLVGEFIDISPHVTPRSLIVSYALGVVLTFLTVTFSSWRISNINIVRAIRDIPDPPMQGPQWRAHGLLGTIRRLTFKPGGKSAWVLRPGLLVVAVVCMMSTGAVEATWMQVLIGIAGALLFLTFIFITFQMGALLVAASVPLLVVGTTSLAAFPLYAGLSFLPIGLALVIRSFGANERITYTTAGLLLLYVWLADFQFNLIEKVFGKAEGDIEMFFLSGVMITVASVFLLVYNSDIFLGVFTRLGWLLGRLLPSVRMAVAYPLANKGRTGMTMAMFCLVVFALIVMSAMNYNFTEVFVSDRALGGFDIYVDESPANPLIDLRAALRDQGATVTESFRAVGTSLVATQRRAAVCQERQGSLCIAANARTRFRQYRVLGEDAEFLETAQLPLQTRARGYEDDSAAWSALVKDPNVAIIDSNAVAGGFGEPFITGVEPDAKTMDPIDVTVIDRKSGVARTLKVIGIIELGPSNWYVGLHVSNEAFQQIFEAPDFRRFSIQTAAGADNRDVARQVESALLNTGAQAESLRYTIDQQSSLFTGFFRIIQGFMGLGLFVGVAAVGVIAFRTVVERRQQIGMLRALGYSRGMVGLTFLLESAFIAAGGITTGIVFGLILARFLIHDEFSNQGVVDFVIPYVQVVVIAVLSFGSALAMTVLPSWQASSIPIAKALRYE